MKKSTINNFCDLLIFLIVFPVVMGFGLIFANEETINFINFILYNWKKEKLKRNNNGVKK